MCSVAHTNDSTKGRAPRACFYTREKPVAQATGVHYKFGNYAAHRENESVVIAFEGTPSLLFAFAHNEVSALRLTKQGIVQRVPAQQLDPYRNAVCAIAHSIA